MWRRVILGALVCAAHACDSPPEEPVLHDAGGSTEPRDAGSAGTDAGRFVSSPPPLRPGGGSIALPPERSGPLPPVGSGSMITFGEGRLAAISDPDRDMIWIADLAHERPLGWIALDEGDRPGRLAADAHGRIHVTLWNRGEVATIDPVTMTIVERRAVCGAPRGLVYERRPDVLHVACARGELITLPARGGPPVRTVHLDSDLRDVVIDGEGLAVSRFRSAEVLFVDAAGAIVERQTPPDFTPTDVGEPRPTFVPHAAWRMITLREGGVALLHQRASNISLTVIAGSTVVSGVRGYYFQSPATCTYGVLHTAVTRLRRGEPAASAGVAGLVLPVDLAEHHGGDIYIAAAGLDVVGRPSVGLLSGERFAVAGLAQSCETALFPLTYVGRVPAGQVTSLVATRPWGVIAFSRAHAWLATVGWTESFGIDFGWAAQHRESDAHTRFHQATPTMVACVSCHPEGGDDGHVWVFAGSGARRTQTLVGGLLSSAPFHWSGDQPDMAAILEGGYTIRMNGGPLTEANARAMGNWLDSLPATPPTAPRDPAAAARGAETFTRECAACHAGPRSSNDATVDVGTGEPLQVPTLVDLALRAPYMHSGCAPTLRDALGPCGGPTHDISRRLDAPTIDDLLAFLETL